MRFKDFFCSASFQFSSSSSLWESAMPGYSPISESSQSRKPPRASIYIKDTTKAEALQARSSIRLRRLVGALDLRVRKLPLPHRATFGSIPPLAWRSPFRRFDKRQCLLNFKEEVRMRRGFSVTVLTALAVLIQTLAAAEGASLVERLGYPPETKLLIVHADDVGMCHSVNTATFEAMTKGWVSSASLMVPCPWFPEAAAFAKSNPHLDFGLHLTLNSEWRYYRWGPVTPAPVVKQLVDGEGFLHRNYIETLAYAGADEVEMEIRAQVQRALSFGIKPTHVDSHMGTLFMRPSYFEAYRKVAREFKLPYLLPPPTLNPTKMLDPRRRVSRNGTLKEAEASGDVMIDQLVMGIDVAPDKRTQTYLETIQKMRPGVTEILIHCGKDTEELRAVTSNWANRVADARAFTDPVVRKALDEAGIQLIGWSAIKKLQYGEK